MTTQAFVVWGPELSPFLLKLEALLVHAGLPFRRLPRDGSRLENLRTTLLLENAKRNRSARRPPANEPLDEYPLVPFLLTPGGEVLYDSSALAAWIDAQGGASCSPLVPTGEGAAFVASLIDEALDEFGLYLVHHYRWKFAARDNDEPGRRLAREYARQLPPGLARPFAAWFARRQVRRLPYLFSVAPPGYREEGLATALTPPGRKEFPPTHDLLEEAWERYLGAVESVLAVQRCLLGEGFTVADASVYGQLSMNLTDTAAARRLAELAPATFAWLQKIRRGEHATWTGEAKITPTLSPLLGVILDTFVPLMQANAAAWNRARGSGTTRFNEAAFDADEALYDGELLGRPFRSVAKTFQVRVWRDLCRQWANLSASGRDDVQVLLPGRDLDAAFAAGAAEDGAAHGKRVS